MSDFFTRLRSLSTFSPMGGAQRPKSPGGLERSKAVRGRSRTPRSEASPSSNGSTPKSGVGEADSYFPASSPGTDATSRSSGGESRRSLTRALSPNSLKKAFWRGAGRAADGLQKVADYSTPADTHGAQAAPRQAYPGVMQLLRRYADDLKLDDQRLRSIAARIIKENPRFDERDPAFVEFSREAPASDALFSKFETREHLLTQDLVGLKSRAINTLTLPDPDARVLTQRFGHMRQDARGEYHLVPNQSLSSDAIKHDFSVNNGFMRQYNANLGSVKDGDKVLFIRSARTDSPKKLEELLLFGAAEQPHGAGPYRAAIISAMDLSVAKDVATRVKGENERDLLRAQGRAVNALFGKRDTIKRTLADGRTVELQRPVLLNTVLSGQAKSGRNIVASRAYNEAGLTDLGQALAKQWRTHEWHAARSIAESLSMAKTPEQMKKVLDSPMLYAAYMSVAGFSPKDALALLALRVGMTGSDFLGRSYNGPTDPGKELTLMKHLLDVTGRVPHGQCKSGEDRTLTLESMFLTAHQYEAIRRVPYNPALVDKDPASKKLARRLFTEIANTFGEDPIKDVRGAKGKAKWGFEEEGDASHPVPGEMYIGGADSRIGQPGR